MKKRNLILRSVQLTFIIFISAIISESESGKSSSKKKSKANGGVGGEDVSYSDFNSSSSKVYYGIPLLYQQRQELAQELGVNPVVTMSDFLFRTHHPLFPPGFFDNTMSPMDNSILPEEIVLNRKRRGIIWNKIKKIKKGIHSAKKKVWKIKEKAVSIVKGKDKNTPRPKYESTGGSWGKPVMQGQGWARPSRAVFDSPGSYGSGYSSSKDYGVSGPVGRNSAATDFGNTGWARTYSPSWDNNNSRSNNQGWGSSSRSFRSEPNYKGLAVRSKVTP